MSTYYEQLQEGIKYEEFVYKELEKYGIIIKPYMTKNMQLKGENAFGIEVKYDKKFHSTNNFYIETHEKSDPSNRDFIESGIFRQDNSWLWAQGDYEELYIFGKKHLLHLYRNHADLQRKETATSKGFLLPINYKDGIYFLRKIIFKF